MRFLRMFRIPAGVIGALVITMVLRAYVFPLLRGEDPFAERRRQQEMQQVVHDLRGASARGIFAAIEADDAVGLGRAAERQFPNVSTGLNIRNRRDESPLTCALRLQASTEIFEVLLTHGADPDVRDGTGRTPREAAADSGRSDVLALMDEQAAR